MTKFKVYFLIGANIFLTVVSVFLDSFWRPIDLSGKFNPDSKIAFFHDQKLLINPSSLGSNREESRILGETSGKKRIEIDLTNQRLYAYEGDNLVYNFLISSGKWGKTPTGTFRIWVKLRYSKMEGGSKALRTYYYLPNVPYVMYFYNDQVPKSKGFGIHGTYWHNNFGHPMSHGCVNMKTAEAEKIYYWVNPEVGKRGIVYASEENPGAEIIIYGEAPKE